MSTRLHYSGPSHFYRELAELPVPTSAKFTSIVKPESNFAVARVSYSTRDQERNVKRSITKTFTLCGPESPLEGSVLPPTIIHDPSEVLAFLPARSEERHALLREVPDGQGTKKRYVEVWSGAQLEASHEVTKLHGPFHTDDYFKSFSFAPSETALVYAAEANPETITEQSPDDPFLKFHFVPNFGEQLYTRKRPTLFMFRWKPQRKMMDAGSDPNTMLAASVTALIFDTPPTVPVVFGQATFLSETRLYATGYEQTVDGRLLGIKGCFNHASSIWELRLLGETSETTTTTTCQSTRIEMPGRSCRSPRVLFDKDHIPETLFWLSNPLGGPHASTVSLHARDLKGQEGDRTLVEAVYDPSHDVFPGLYTECNLADNPFLRLGDKTYVLVQSLWRSRPTLLSIDVDTGTVIDVTPDEPFSEGSRLYSWSLFATDGRRLAICSRSTPTSPPETILLTFTNNDLSSVITVLDRPSVSDKLQAAISRLKASIIPIPNRYPVETIVIQSKEVARGPGSKPVCLTIIHGGPHASSFTSFTPGVLAYALEGYTVSLPNYTGSTGFGEKYIQKLIGKCGSLDVADCFATVEELIHLGLAETGRQIVLGGSHGGFLTAHLIGQYPDAFAAAVMRNPVISAGELCTSDISDWAFREFGLEHAFGPGAHVTPEAFSTLYQASPIAHVDCVKTPVLVLLGEDDLRVPPAQGRGYYHVLKGKNDEAAVEMLVFPKETHPIDGIEAARVVFEAGRDWFRTFIKQE